MTSAGHRYRLYGFELASALALPELAPANGTGGPADVTLELASTPERLVEPPASGVCFEAAKDEMLCWLSGVGRFHVQGGRRIAVDPAPGVGPALLRRCCLSTPLAALLLQRGLLPLHASAVATPRGAAVFVASAAGGKSTLAAAMQRRGFPVLADDLAALRCDAGKPLVLAGVSGVRLWGDSQRVLGLREGDGMGGAGEKRWFQSNPLPETPPPLEAIYLLNRGEVPAAGSLRRLRGAEGLSAVMDAVYRPAFVRGLGLMHSVFAGSSAVMHASRVMVLTSPADSFEPDRMVAAVEKDLGL